MAIALEDTRTPARAAREGVRTEAGTIAAMDWLRGLSVAWIVLFHFSVLRDPAIDPWAAVLRSSGWLGEFISSGPLAVDLFFLISGFLLTLPWHVRVRDGRTAPDAKAFYRRRILRIVPAYYASLALLFVVVMPVLHGATYWRSDLYVDIANAIAHALFVHNLSPLTSGSLGVNGALWTLAVEAQFYAVLPLLAPLVARAPLRALAFAAAVSAAWLWSSRHGFDAIVRWHIELGSHWHWDEATIRRLLAMQLPAFLGDFALGAALSHLWLARDRMARPLRRSFAMAVLPLAKGPLPFLGRISYSTYLWHLPLLLMLRSRANIAPAHFLLAYLASVLAVGWISWRCLELPFMRAGERARASPRQAP